MERNKSGFSLAEIIVGLFIVTMITVLIGALGQQAAQFSNKTKQIGTVLELRTKIAAVSKDPEEFLTKMQTVRMTGTNKNYQTCLQDATNTLSSFTCPPVKEGLIDPANTASYDEEIHRYAGTVYKVTDSEILDTNGEKIAGTIAHPHYLTADGLECSATPKNKKCPLMSTGYFFRTNDATDQDPGSVKFLVKVASNPESKLGNSGTTPMKAQYMSIDLGSKWGSAGPCPGTSIQVGVKTNGSPMCLVPINCGPSSLLVGVKPNASPDCKSIPPCPTNKRIVLNDDGDLECVGNSPCDVGQVHLGYYSGTSDPICSSPTSCATGEVLLGNKCETIDNCVGTERLTFANNTFSCQAVTTVSGEQCTKAGEFLVGFDAQGKAKCEAGIAGKDGKDGTDGVNGKDGRSGADGKDGKSIATGECPDGKVVYGINANGSLKCRGEEAPPDPPKLVSRIYNFGDTAGGGKEDHDLGCHSFCALASAHDCSTCGFRVSKGAVCSSGGSRWSFTQYKGGSSVVCVDEEVPPKEAPVASAEHFSFPDVPGGGRKDTSLGCFTFCALAGAHDCNGCGFRVTSEGSCTGGKLWNLTQFRGSTQVTCLKINPKSSK